MQERDTKLHPIASIFPAMSEAEFEKLKADIAENGQRESIVYWNQMLVDGRHRLRACQELNIEPMEVELEPSDDPVAYAVSTNLNRRHLKQSQRAMIAAKMATMGEGRPSKTRSNDLFNQDDAAAMLSVSVPTLKRAKYVLDHGSQSLIDAVERTDITVAMAAKLCKACPDKREQSRLVKEGKESIRVYLNPTPHEEASEEVLGDDQYEYQIVKMFSHADYRINTMRKLIDSLNETERAIVSEWFESQA